MAYCPILRQEIVEDECSITTKEAYKEGKERPILHSKFRKINGWKAICKNCKNHKKS
ncbi:MAG: hypothetical protein K0R21_706 [Anaerocolumna sp.]|jgi:hypothetical protein|nr:hypothetical protein [Anaerocolumna sp.]